MDGDCFGDSVVDGFLTVCDVELEYCRSCILEVFESRDVASGRYYFISSGEDGVDELFTKTG